MPATTVKLEGALLKQIQALKPRQQTLASYVREALKGDLKRRRLAHAAQQYHAFLSANPAEREELSQWSNAPLATAPRRRKR